MLWYRLILVFGLGLVQLAVAAAGATTTSAVPTKTNCPLYYATPAVPSPTKSACNVPGVLGKANTLNTYCGEEIPGLGDRDFTNYTIICYRACARDPNCVSFSIDPASNVCYTYGKSLTDMAFQLNPNKFHFFYNIRDCYNCTSPPPPARSACASYPQPKSPKPANYTCGTLGTVANYSQAIFGRMIDSNPRTCYELCATFYDPVGVCESYLTDDPIDYYPTCYIFDKPLRELGFTPDPNKYFRGWNLHGCYNCNISYPPVPSCIPPMGPFDVGVRNGNFQDTYYNTSTMRVELREWSDFGYPFVANGTNGNKFLNLTTVQTATDDKFNSAGLFQTVYGLDHDPRSPGRFYNLSFDLAIPESYHNTKPACNLTVSGTGYTNVVTISGDDRKYAGTTFRPYGPFLVDVQSYYPGYEVFFYAICNDFGENKTRQAKAVFWVDNFRITQNGRDVGT